MEAEQFLKLWKDLGDQKQIMKNIHTSHTVDTVKDRLLAVGLHYIASRTKTTGKVVYYFLRYREFDILIELLHKMTSKSIDFALRRSEPQGHGMVVLKYLCEVISP